MPSYSYPIVGTDEPVLKQRKFSWVANSGSSADEVWDGFNFEKMATKYNGLILNCQEAELVYGGAMAELTIKWGPGGSGGGGGSSLTVTIDRWECPEPEVTKSVWDHPSFLAAQDVALAYFSLSVDDYNRAYYIARWSAAAAQGTDFKSFVYGTGWAGFVSAYPAEASYMARTYQKAAGGQTHYADTQYSIRHTTRAPNYWSRNVADNNVNCILSPALLMAEVTDGSLWNFPMPGRLQYKVASAVSALTARLPARSNYAIGWRKKASSETTIHGGWIEIATGYVLDQWSTDLYPYVS